MRTARILCAGALACAVLASSRAHAEPSVDPYTAFPMIVPHEKHYLRAVLEVGGILFVGFVDYLLNTTDRGGTMRPDEERWSLRYDWPVLREKLIGTGLDLDGNRFTTNYVSHPLAGTLYYTAARSNHLSFAESYAFAIVGSTTWEFFGEIREQTSLNDLIVTPVSGAAIGESMMQLASVFQRGPKSFAADAAAFVLAPLKSINEWTEGAQPLRGGPQPWHRFDIGLGVGATVQEAPSAGRSRAVYVDERFSADMRVANLPDHAGAGKHARLFDDGNVSRIQVDLALSGGRLVEGSFATRLVPVGYYTRDVEVDASGALRGHGTLVGLRMGFEYTAHDYDRDRVRAVDAIGIASPIGIALEHTYVNGKLDIRTGLDMSGAMSGVRPYGLARYSERHTLDDALTPVRQHGYYHAVAVSVEPFVDVGYGGLRLGASLRLDTFHSIRGLDENELRVAAGPRFGDRRAQLRGTAAYVLPGTPWRAAIDVRRSSRSGSAGEVDDERSETSLWGSLGVSF